jgi:hypothetical protein
LVAHLDAAIRHRAIGLVEPAHLGVLDVDPDRRGDLDRLAVEEDVEVGMDVIDQELLGRGLQAGSERALERVRRRGPEEPGLHRGRRRRGARSRRRSRRGSCGAGSGDEDHARDGDRA